MEKVSLGPRFDLVVIGGSAGSLSVIVRVLEVVRDLRFPILLVMHRSGESGVAETLAYRAAMPVREIEEKEIMQPGTMYIAPADYHVLIEKEGALSLDISEKVNFSRPSIDVTFESAAEVFGSRLLGVLLSGANNDGTEGLRCIRQRGGKCLVQDPETAEVPFMPEAARLALPDCEVISGNDLAEYLNKL